MISYKSIISQGLPKLYTIHGGSSEKKDPRSYDLGSWRGREDLNLRGAFYTPYSLSRGAPSATWVLPHRSNCTYLLRSKKMAERVGFEPTDAFTSPVFKTGAFNRSAISPCFYGGHPQTQNLYYHTLPGFVNQKLRKSFPFSKDFCSSVKRKGRAHHRVMRPDFFTR